MAAQEDAQNLREATQRLITNEERITALNAQIKELRDVRNGIEGEIKDILRQPVYNNIHQLSLSNGKTIKIVREHNKGWSLPKSLFRDLVHQFYQSGAQNTADNLINYVYVQVHQHCISTEMKLELR